MLWPNGDAALVFFNSLERAGRALRAVRDGTWRAGGRSRTK